MVKKVTFDKLSDTTHEFTHEDSDILEIAQTTLKKRVPFLINIEKGNISAEGNIFRFFDFSFVNSMYEKKVNNIPIIYNEMYNFIDNGNYKKIKKISKNKKYAFVTYSPDVSVSVATTNAIAEKFGKQELKIIVLTSQSRINTTIKKINNELDFSESLISSLLGEVDTPFFNNKINISPDQIVLIGINEDYISDTDIKELNDIFNERYIPLHKMKQHNIKYLLNKYVLTEVNRPTHIIFDLSVSSFCMAPMCMRNLNGKQIQNPSEIEGFNHDELNTIFEELSKLNIVGLDVTNYDIEYKYNNDDRAIKVTCETARIPMKKIFNLQEHSFNIFNEFSKFLIFRPVKQDNSEDSGWYIFRNMTENADDQKMNNEIKNKIISEIEDNIILFDPYNPPVLNNIYDESTVYDAKLSYDTIFLSTTTIDEQNKKIFIKGNTDINEKILYPAEKTRMVFELLL